MLGIKIILIKKIKGESYYDRTRNQRKTKGIFHK